MLFKLEKQPCLLLRSYQLIALLSCIGKVLEQVLVRRLAYLVLKYTFSLSYLFAHLFASFSGFSLVTPSTPSTVLVFFLLLRQLRLYFLIFYPIFDKCNSFGCFNLLYHSK